MSLTKRYFKTKDVCRVTFRLEPEKNFPVRQVFLVGEFNNWDPSATPMKRLCNGSFKVELDFPLGTEYQFRYLLDGERWQNDPEADKYVACDFAGVENSVVMT